MPDGSANENGTEAAEKADTIRLAGFVIRNIMGIKRVDVTVEAGKTIIFGGRNKQGKSSILKALWMAFGGKRAIYEDSIRHGETKGTVEIDVDAYTVKLVLDTTKGPKFEVRRKDGTLVRAPMALVRTWMGLIGFDVLEFFRLGETKDGRAKQAKMLMEMADLDFEAIDKEYADTFEERRAVNRDAKALQATVESMAFYPAAPDEEVSVAALVAQIEEINGANDARREEDARKGALERKSEELALEAARLAEDISEAEARLKNLRQEAKEKKAKADAIDIPDELPTEDLKQQIADAEDTNAAVRANQAHAKAKARLEEETVKQTFLTGKLDGIKKRKADALAAAVFPLDGLSVRGEDNDTIYNGTPLANLSDSEQIMVSTELALANCGDLKLAMIDGLEALDPDSIRIIKARVESAGANLVASMVSDGEECSFIIEEGEIVETQGLAADDAEGEDDARNSSRETP